MFQRLRREVRTLLIEEEQGEQQGNAPWWRQAVRFWVMVGQSFVGNRCPVRATALAYSSLLAFIPLLAVVIGISTSLLKNDEARIRGWIDDVLVNLVPQLMKTEEFADTKDTVVSYILSTIDNVQSGTLGTTGMIALLVLILFMLSRVEETMNDIWGVSQGRSWYARLVNYWAAISLGPVLIFAAIGFSTSLRLGPIRPGNPEFTSASLRDAASLAAQLKAPDDAVSAYLRGRLSRETAGVLEGWSGEGRLPEALRAQLVAELNAVVAGDSIFESNRFAGVRLRPGTERAVGEAGVAVAEGIPVARRNRLLLEDAYPAQVVRMDRNWIERLPVVGTILIALVPIPLLGGACALFYALMPNTRVQWRAALVGGLVAGVLWYLNNELGVRFVTEATRNRAIYNSLAAVPVFMVGLYFFWMLLLFGAQVAYTFQNRHSYLAARRVDRVHQAGREFVALRILIETARDFVRGAPPPSLGVLAERLEVPGQLVSQTLAVLRRTRLLVEVNGGEPAYVPGRPLETIRVADVLEAMRRGLGSQFPTRSDEGRKIAEGVLADVTEAEQEAGGRTLAELVEGIGARRGSGGGRLEGGA
ncbi:MAG: YihY/virulence factor BrkB family protein [Verrucomicrobiae bacterium]|nr:YihY/virulence factor BrkB family protein [Verrucomicrobiae bacterium]